MHLRRGTETDTRIAYVDRTGIRVVAGDGTGDRLLVPGGRGPVAWQPRRGFRLAYADPRGRVVLVDAQSGEVLWRSNADGRVVDLEWSSDGRRVAALRARARDDVAVYTARGALYTGFRTPRGVVSAAATRPDSHGRAVAVRVNGRATLLIPRVPGSALSGPGSLDDLTWSPDGRWLLVGWPNADQWVFVRGDGKRIRAVSNISSQFRSRTFPQIQSWCCMP